jgi:hypothetical protein
VNNVSAQGAPAKRAGWSLTCSQALPLDGSGAGVIGARPLRHTAAEFAPGHGIGESVPDSLA